MLALHSEFVPVSTKKVMASTIHSWACTEKTITETLAHLPPLLLCCSLWLGTAASLGVHQVMKEETQWNITQVQKRTSDKIHRTLENVSNEAIQAQKDRLHLLSRGPQPSFGCLDLS